MQGDAVFDIVFDLLGSEVILKGCTDDAGRDSVDTNVVIGEFASKRTSELGKSAFCYSVRDCTQATPGCPPPTRSG